MSTLVELRVEYLKKIKQLRDLIDSTTRDNFETKHQEISLMWLTLEKGAEEFLARCMKDSVEIVEKNSN